ncbi:MAG: FUSC family protein [Bacteroidia bacterium]
MDTKSDSPLRKLTGILITSNVCIYTVKCLIGFSVGYFLIREIPNHEMNWTLLSILLVLSPDDVDAKRLAIERMKANLIGSAVGLLCYVIYKPNLYIILVGVVITIATCYFFKLMNVTRTALATLIIVFIYEQKSATWHSAIERLLCVAGGCLIGVAITLLTAIVVNYLRKKLHFDNNINGTRV